MTEIGSGIPALNLKPYGPQIESPARMSALKAGPWQGSPMSQQMAPIPAEDRCRLEVGNNRKNCGRRQQKYMQRQGRVHRPSSMESNSSKEPGWGEQTRKTKWMFGMKTSRRMTTEKKEDQKQFEFKQRQGDGAEMTPTEKLHRISGKKKFALKGYLRMRLRNRASCGVQCHHEHPWNWTFARKTQN